MVDINEILGDKTEVFVKRYPNITKYIEKYYVIDEKKDFYGFDFELNDSVSSVTKKEGLRKPHSQAHIAKDVAWAKQKMEEFYNSSKTPSWFRTEEDLSLNLEKIFIQDAECLEKIERWAADRDIYYNDSSRNRLTITTTAKIPGLCLEAGEVKEVSGIRIVLEYTEFHADGEFIIYTVYPCEYPEA